MSALTDKLDAVLAEMVAKAKVLEGDVLAEVHVLAEKAQALVAKVEGLVGVGGADANTALNKVEEEVTPAPPVVHVSDDDSATATHGAS